MKNKEAVNGKQKETKRYPVVGIGASAGGLEAISELLGHLPADTGMAYVYIQHLDPTHKSMLSEILQRVTKMKVREAEDMLAIQPNEVYIIPPNRDLTIVDEVLVLNERQPKPSLHLPIDQFFCSLAEKQKESAIGIVLSGNANDGTYGLKVIKQAGGLTFAQDDTAKFQSMPHSAIGEGVVDLVLSPAEMGKELGRISHHPAIPKIIEEEAEAASSGKESPDTDLSLSAILHFLKRSVGVDFSHYKTNTIKRRIIRRMLIYKLNTLEDYLKYLKDQPGEAQILYQDILINVTSFFRDRDTMEFIKKTLLPAILKRKKPTDTLRAWVPACASGEEVYSLAIVLMEACGDKDPTIHVQIFASDLSDVSIAKARLGIYSKNELAGVSSERLQRFFEPVDGHFRIIKSVRDMCIFATHNVLKDPPFSRLDLISCCNLMIYLDNSLQKKVISIFHYALNADGLLMLGKSESTSTAPGLFNQTDKKYKIYQKTNHASNPQIFGMHYSLRNGEKEIPKEEKESSVPPGKLNSLEKIIDDILLEEYIPPAVVVNLNLDILQFRGATSLFIEPSSGKASLNLLKMARNGLSYEIRNLVRKAARTGQRAKKVGLDIQIKSMLHHVCVEVIPLKSGESNEELFFILFNEELQPSVSGHTPAIKINKLVKQLQDELIVAKEDMHSIIEEQEASVEELQSANEEIISSNEELQSINEELETSKEEVESANEELQTINTELQVRNEQLSESYEYSEAVFETIDEAVLVLTKDFRVKTANQAFYRIFQVSQEETEGSLLYELGNGQWNILQLRGLFEDVVSSDKAFNGFEIEHNFPHVGRKIMVLNARRIIQEIHRQHLVILAIRDITEHRQAQKIIAEQESRFRNMANNVPIMIWTMDGDGSCNFMNKTRLQYTGRTMESEMGSGWMDDIHKDDLAGVKEVYSTNIKRKSPFSAEYRLRRQDGQYRWVNGEGKPNYSQEEEYLGYIIYCIEIHDKKLAKQEIEKKVQQRTEELKAAMVELANLNTELGQFAYAASHDLQEPIRKIITYSDRLIKSAEKRTDTDQGYVEKIFSSAERMRKLINDLLNLTRLSVVEKNFDQVNLNEVMTAVLKDLDLAIEEKSVEIIIDPLPQVAGMTVQLHQLFYNLMANAIKFSGTKEAPRIHISSRKMSRVDILLHPDLQPSLNYIEIMIQDNGIGFSQEFAEQIFTIFQRLNSNSSGFAGSGIGLALCRKIVTNHKGIIFAQSTAGQGACFTVMLPHGN